MKKTIFLLSIVALSFSNAETTKLEKGYAIGVGLGYAQLISLKNPNFDLKSSQKDCMKEVYRDENMAKKTNEFIMLAVNECKKQLKLIKQK